MPVPCKPRNEPLNEAVCVDPATEDVHGSGSVTGFKVVIPARYASTRLPGKPLQDIAGKPMIRHVCERAQESHADEVVVATDDVRIAEVVRGYQGEVEMTRSDHPTGTDRLAEVAQRRGWDDSTIVVNLQGDEPQMPAVLLDQVAQNLLGSGQAVMSTLCVPLTSPEEFNDPNVVKVVRDTLGHALYFSRAPIPCRRDAVVDPENEHPAQANRLGLRHLGIYAYRAGFLKRYKQLAASELERLESLEQLRVLAAGERIHVGFAELPEAPSGAAAVFHGVDTPADLERVRKAFVAHSSPNITEST